MSWWDVLGVEPCASPDEIKRAFRRQAVQCHPDKRGGSHEAFHRLKRAYEDACDSPPHNATKLDQNSTFLKVAAHLMIIIRDVPSEIRIEVDVRLEDLYNNAGELLVTVPLRRWNAANHVVRCVDHTFRIQCPRELLSTDGGVLELVFKHAGHDNERLAAIMHASVPFARGHLRVVLRYVPHPKFSIDDILSDGRDLFTDVEISLWEYYVGSTLRIAFLDGTDIQVRHDMALALNADTDSVPLTHAIRVPGKGLLLKGENKRGDLYVHVRPRLPRLSERHLDRDLFLAAGLAPAASDG